MKKLKLLFAAFALLLGGSNASAQTDVTGTYLTNADFSTGTPIDNNVCTYGKDMAANNTTYYGAQSIEGWINSSVGTSADGYEGCALAGALFAYGSTPWLAGSGNVAPATDPDGAAGNAAGLCAVWGNSIQYTQDATLPAGSYTIVFKVYNATSGSGNSSGVITKDLFGFKADAGTEYYAPNNTFAIGQWSTVAVTFNLVEATAGKISMGYVGPGGGAAMPHLFVDNVKILKNEVYEDCTNKVNKTGWSGATDGYQGGTINTARQYGDKSVGRHIYQTVSGLDNGSYEVAIYSISQKEWNGTLANDAGDVAYVVAEGAYELKEMINARARAAYPGDENLGIYTISGVKVTDGTLTLGMGLDKANLTEWHHVQIKSLIRTNAPDLSDFIEAYNNALAAAQAVDQSAKMAASIKSALQGALNTYADDKVDKTSQEALETATAALNTATANANTSIASYAILAGGTIRTDVLDGWTCTNSQTFHINTWSTEGNSDGSGMTTPFIENWRNKNDNAGLDEGTFSYTLVGLEPGEVYYAQALIRSYNERSTDAPNGPNFFINDVETSLSEAGTTFTYNKMSGIYATLGGAATVGNDGKIVIGARIANDANYNWVAFKNVSIQSMSDAYDAAVEKVTALAGVIPTAVYNVAYAVVEKWNAAYPTTAAGFEEAIGEIEAAAATAAECKAPFAAYYALNTKAYTLSVVNNDNKDANDAFNTAMMDCSINVDGAKNPAEINVIADNLKAAMQTYVFAANPVGDGAKFDCTFLMTNPDVTGMSGKPAGWATEQEGGNFQVTTNAAREGYSPAYCVEYWSENARATNLFSVYNTVNLPEGTYTMNCYAFASPNNVQGATKSAVYFYANDTQGSLVTADNLTAASISFVNKETGDVKVGLKTMEGNEFRWMGIGYVELYKVPAQTYTVSENVAWDNTQSGAGAVNLTRTIKEGFNTLVLPFSMTQAEVEAAFGEGSVVYDLNSIDGDTWHFVTYSGISANRPCILKATVAGTSYNFADRTIVAGAPEHNVVGGGMTGNYAASITVPEGNYIISESKLYLVNSDVTIKGTRAYFKLTENNGARTMNLSFDGVTGIATVENGEVKKIFTGEIYDLQGRKVENPSNGIYVVEGKKVVF